jgi:hypothetical protein
MAAGRNFVNNGGYDIWQRGTSISVSGAISSLYTADRWTTLNSTGNFTVSRQATGDTTNLPFVQYAARFQRNSGQTSTSTTYLTQSLESANSIPLAGRTVTFSFYARRGANYSAPSTWLGVDLNSGTGTDQNINQGFTGSAVVISQSATLTTTWQRFTYTGTIGATATQLGFYFYYNPTGTAGANDWFEVTGVQLELGSVATTFSRQGGTIQGELAACQRYYFRYKPDASAVRNFGQGHALSATVTLMNVVFPVTMRIRPTAIEQSGTAADYVAMTANGGQNALTAVPAFDGITTDRLATINCATTGLVSGNSTYLFSANGNAYLGWSAEL